MFVDDKGRYLPTAKNFTTPEVAGYRVDVQVMGFGHLRLPHRPPIPSTIRAFAAITFDLHLGMAPNDPSGLEDEDHDGFSRPTNAGCPQPASVRAADRGKVKGPTGISKDDPDRDGWCYEISEGELDVMKWYELNHPRPGRGGKTVAVV